MTKLRVLVPWWQKEEKNGGKMQSNSQFIKKVAEIYDWLDLQIRVQSDLAGQCDACGKCCVFDKPAPTTGQGFDHRLFLTTPELMYLTTNLGAEGINPPHKRRIKPMLTSICPYNIDGKCSVYKYRFAGCRIFCCRGDADFQTRLSESAIKKFKSICAEFRIPYRYSDLATALETFSKLSSLRRAQGRL